MISLHLISLSVLFTLCKCSVDLFFVIINQNESHHIEKSKLLKESLVNDADILDIKITVKVSTEDFDDIFTWVYFPLIGKLSKEESSWFIFLNEYCQVDLNYLHKILMNYSANKEFFFGHELYDHQPTIIHHFDSVNPQERFLYPDPRTGIILSKGLLTRLTAEWAPHKNKIDFSIDAAYELSKFIYSLEVKLKNLKGLCIEKQERCFIWNIPMEGCKQIPDPEKIHFAVKTCEKLSKERIPVLRETWLPEVVSYGLYSDTQDEEFGTLSLNIPNTERGHCGKTMAIIKHVASSNGIDWLVITDDDTLISLSRLSSLLSCYSPTKKLSLGEKYSYMAVSGSGFDYITGGGGIVLSKEALLMLAIPGVCECPSNDTPDDMYLGSCLKRLRIPIIHSRRFHQARPEDYPYSLLKNTAPISFHKFWMNDPRSVFREWLKDDQTTKEHEEL